jgi:Tfp pilus assembly protein PilO
MLFRGKQQLIICILASVIIGGFMLFRYIPLKRELRSIERNISSQRLVIAKGNADKKQLVQFEDQLNKLQNELGDYEEKIPDSMGLGEFLRQIADLMKKNKLQDQVVEPREEIKGEKFCSIPLRLQCKGTLSQIFEFYQNLQSMGRLIRIEDIKLLNDAAYSGWVSMETNAVIYYRV